MHPWPSCNGPGALEMLWVWVYEYVLGLITFITLSRLHHFNNCLSVGNKQSLCPSCGGWAQEKSGGTSKKIYFGIVPALANCFRRHWVLPAMARFQIHPRPHVGPWPVPWADPLPSSMWKMWSGPTDLSLTDVLPRSKKLQNKPVLFRSDKIF